MKTIKVLVFLLLWGTVDLLAKPQKNKVKVAPSIQEFVLPFHLASKLIIVEAKVNNQSGYFIVDTGLPDLVMNNQYFKGENKVPFTEMNGQSIVATEVTLNFQLGKTKAKNRTILAIDLSALEQKTNLQILGIIGYQQLKKYELLFNYEKKTIHFFLLNRRGERLSDIFYPELAAAIKIPFRWKGHMPVIPITRGTTKLYFGIDSGAGINLITRDKEHYLTENNPYVTHVNILNLGKKSVKAQRKVLEEGIIDFYTLLPMKTLACKLSTINHRLAGKKIDGIIGYEFLRQQKVSINFNKKQIFLWPKTDPPQQILALGEKNKTDEQ